MIKQNAILATKDEIQRKERMAELISRVADGLSGDALKVAMDLGDELEKDDGLQTLIDRIDSYVTTFKEDEARELFHIGSRTDGPLARQQGEPMASDLAIELMCELFS